MKKLLKKGIKKYIKEFENKQGITLDYWIDKYKIADFHSYCLDMNDIIYDIDNNVKKNLIFEWHDDVLLNHKELGIINYQSYCKGLRYTDLQIFQICQNKIDNNVYAGLFSELEKLGFKIDKTKLKKTLENQHFKGFQKYGHTLKDCPKEKFNWQEMALEELADFLQYLEK